MDGPKDTRKRLASLLPSTAARAVGYESPSQFSRVFKRLFGVSPVAEADHTRGPSRRQLKSRAAI